jgi:uncharacterized protein YfaT (DUF1175 family)
MVSEISGIQKVFFFKYVYRRRWKGRDCATFFHFLINMLDRVERGHGIKWLPEEDFGQFFLSPSLFLLPRFLSFSSSFKRLKPKSHFDPGPG